ncbi:MAG: hypothetical protein ACOZDY_15005 [Pseudomonadota bacterium]
MTAFGSELRSSLGDGAFSWGFVAVIVAAAAIGAWMLRRLQSRKLAARAA